MIRRGVIPPRTCRRHLIAGWLLGLSLLLGLPCLAIEDNLEIGLDTRYSALGREDVPGPRSLNGVGLGARFAYTIDNVWRINLGGSLRWYESYLVTETAAPPIEDPTAEDDLVPIIPDVPDDPDADIDTEKGFSYSGVKANSLELSIEYVLDIMRILPFVGVGAIVTRTYQQMNEVTITSPGSPPPTDPEEPPPPEEKWFLNVGYRISLGFDYWLFNSIGMGIVLQTDNYLLERGSYSNQLAVLMRATVCLDGKGVGVGNCRRR